MNPKPLIVLTVAALLSACGGDAEANLLTLPDRVIGLVREGEWDDAFDYVADDFTAHGLSRAQARVFAPRYLADSGYTPYVAHVSTQPGHEGEEERTLTVLGVLCRGNPADANPKQVKAFRLVIQVRLDGGDWVATSATVHR